MRFLLGVIAILLSATSCAGKKVESRQAEQPTEVAGGFGLTMQCSVLNRNTEDAASSSIGCLVYNDDGSRFTGSIAGTTAEIVTSSGGVITTAQIVSGSSAGSYSVGVEVANLKPSDAATIRISATFDNSPRILVASLKGRLATTCDEAVTYYVRKDADPKNIICTENQPCPTINRALDVLPDIINCKVTIEIAAGEYHEAIKIDTKSLTNRGFLVFVGKKGEARPTIVQPPGDNGAHINPMGLDNVSAQVTPAVLIKDIDLKGNGIAKIRGVAPRSSRLGLENVNISDYDTAIWLADASSIFLKDVMISNVNTGLIAPNQTTVVRFSGAVTVTGKIGAPTGMWIRETMLMSLAGSFNLKIQNFSQGFILEKSIMTLQPGHQIAVENVATGINLLSATINLQAAEAAECQQPGASETAEERMRRTLSISVKNFSHTGINLRQASLSDQGVKNDNCLTSISLEASSSSEKASLITAADSSNIVLASAALNLCPSISMEKTPWHNAASNPSIYAMTVHSNSEALFHWNADKNPFVVPSSCPTVGANIFAKTYLYRFLAPSSGDGDCPIGYQKASDKVCYGSMGYFRHRYNVGEDFFFKFLGVLESDSRIDNLPTP